MSADSDAEDLAAGIASSLPEDLRDEESGKHPNDGETMLNEHVVASTSYARGAYHERVGLHGLTIRAANFRVDGSRTFKVRKDGTLNAEKVTAFVRVLTNSSRALRRSEDDTRARRKSDADALAGAASRLEECFGVKAEIGWTNSFGKFGRKGSPEDLMFHHFEDNDPVLRVAGKGWEALARHADGVLRVSLDVFCPVDGLGPLLEAVETAKDE